MEVLLWFAARKGGLKIIGRHVNAASNRSCIWFHDNVSVTISQSTFVNNTAVNGGVIYYETAYLKQNNTKHIAAHAPNDVSDDKRGGHSISPFCAVHDSHFVGNRADLNGGVAHIDGATIDLFAIKSVFTGNKANNEGGAIYTKNLTGTVALQQCLFANNSAGYSGASLFLIGTRSQLITCDLYGNSNSLTVEFEYGISSINNCTFSKHATSSIGAYDTNLNITNIRCYDQKTNCLNIY